MGLHTHGRDPQIGWYERYFGQLKGAQIVDFKMEKETDEEGNEYDEWWPTFIVKMPDGHLREIILSQDEEGNGPGFIFGLDHVEPESAS